MGCHLLYVQYRTVGNFIVELLIFLTIFSREEDFEAAKEKALKIGASKCHVEDRRKEFIVEPINPSIQCNSVYESVYLLG